MAASALKGVAASAVFASALWLALNLAESQTPLAAKESAPPPAGVIGGEDRVRLADFTPDMPQLFPGWETVQDAVVRISCHGGATGGGVLIGDGDRMITAGHVFVHEDGSINYDRSRCLAIHPSGDAVFIETATIKSGGFEVPEALGTHLSVAVTSSDWAVMRLSRAPEGVQNIEVLRIDSQVK